MVREAGAVRFQELSREQPQLLELGHRLFDLRRQLRPRRPARDPGVEAPGGGEVAVVGAVDLFQDGTLGRGGDILPALVQPRVQRLLLVLETAPVRRVVMDLEASDDASQPVQLRLELVGDPEILQLLANQRLAQLGALAQRGVAGPAEQARRQHDGEDEPGEAALDGRGQQSGHAHAGRMPACRFPKGAPFRRTTGIRCRPVETHWPRLAILFAPSDIPRTVEARECSGTRVSRVAGRLARRSRSSGMSGGARTGATCTGWRREDGSRSVRRSRSGAAGVGSEGWSGWPPDNVRLVPAGFWPGIPSVRRRSAGGQPHACPVGQGRRWGRSCPAMPGDPVKCRCR